MDSEWMGSPGGRLCEALRGLRSVFCSQGTRRRLRKGRAHVLAWGTLRSTRFAFNAQSDVLAARLVGIRQEGESLPDGAVHEGTRYTCSCMTSRARCKVRELRVAMLVLRIRKKNGE